MWLCGLHGESAYLVNKRSWIQIAAGPLFEINPTFQFYAENFNLLIYSF